MCLPKSLCYPSVNEKRVANKLPPLEIYTIDVITADGSTADENNFGVKLSSTWLRKYVSEQPQTSIEPIIQSKGSANVFTKMTFASISHLT